MVVTHVSHFILFRISSFPLLYFLFFFFLVTSDRDSVELHSPAVALALVDEGLFSCLLSTQANFATLINYKLHFFISFFLSFSLVSYSFFKYLSLIFLWNLTMLNWY